MKPAAVAIFSTMLLGLSPAFAQGKKAPDVFYTIQVKYVGTGNAEVFIADWRQGQKEILHTTLSQNGKAPAKALAKIVRPTQTDPETDIRWKLINRNLDENGVPLKAGEKGKKTLSWCGNYQTSRDNTEVEVGFKGSGHGNAC